MPITPSTDIGGLTIADQGHAKPQTAADDTYINGAEIDRASYPAESALVIAAVAFTTASGQSGASNTLTLAMYHDTVTGMGTEAALDSDTYAYTWADDGANHGVHVLPVNLEAANRFVRAKAKLTKGGTVTISSQSLGIVVVLGGLQVAPGSGYAEAGYETTTEPVAG